MNRKQKDKSKRKLTEIGRGSLGLTLPAEYIAKLGWKNKQLVKVLLKGRSLIK